MTKRLLCILTVTAFLVFLYSCNNTASQAEISADPAVISKGEAIFNQYCGGCHNFRQDAIGPNLSGLTSIVSQNWIHQFMIDPKKMLESEDERGKMLAEKYKAIMPSFGHLQSEEIASIIAFINTHQQSDPITKDSSFGDSIANPVKEKIAMSNLVVDLEPIIQIAASSRDGQMPLARITKLDFERNSGRTFIVDLRGKLYQLENNTATVYMDMARLRPHFIPEPRVATGFGSFAFHPDFNKNGLLYTTHTEKVSREKVDFKFADSIPVVLQWVLTEWKTATPAAPVFSGTGRELMRINMVTGMHGVQEIAFSPIAKAGDEDYGLLYICVGDGASVEEGYQFIPHSKERVWGTVLRIDPSKRNSSNGKYGIPISNPFAKTTDKNILQEIYAYGFRNPHRISWIKSGEMLVANIGQGNIESINLLKPGHDYGWPIREGNYTLNPYGDLNKLYPLPADDSSYNITYPVAEFDHDEGTAISGGFEYWGKDVPALKGKYFFGDIPSGRLFYINTNEIRQGKKAIIKEWTITINGVANTLLKASKGDRADVHFGRDAGGELYVLTKADGRVYRLKSASENVK
jgi:cytochrome c2